MRKFLANYDMIELKSRLSSIIEVENNDDIQTHFRQIFLLKDHGKDSGSIDKESFKIWTHEQGPTGATGIFYPIIEGFVKPTHQGLEIEFKSKMNLIGWAAFFILVILMAYITISGIIIQENNDFKFLIRRILVGGVFFGGMLFIPLYIHFRTSKIIKNYIIKKLELRQIN